jgi:hypothetical protein
MASLLGWISEFEPFFLFLGEFFESFFYFFINFKKSIKNKMKK